jgi:tRNA(adenine34) deaminase
MPIKDDEYWMQLAIEQATKAAELNEVPVGALLVNDQQQLIASAHNQPITQHDPTSHAEINVLRNAANKLKNYRLNNTTLYVTLEPCVMCVGAMVHARIGRLVYGAEEYKTGAVSSQFQLLKKNLHNHNILVTSGILADDCGLLLSDFFKRRRLEKKNA